ncbi:MAG: hypothetical protein CVT84_01170 [Alphaproteobacteria bacterium HGW-Alphaproteobacteria-6]|nr:MAG: hypothetical protein CVT84_01170 [Alphaproteobacteria bacterium HGW-Alphaproteobacteria-6]
MSRHLADHRAEPEGGRMKHYFAIDRLTAGEGSHPAARMLHKRPGARPGTLRLRQFLRIARGRLT